MTQRSPAGGGPSILALCLGWVRRWAAAPVLLALVALHPIAFAQTIRVADQGDALSMDPHSLDEALQLSLLGNVYEPLVGRNKDLSLAPALAKAWRQTAPTVWRFELRQGVRFHDGSAFTADDVVFSLERAQMAGSGMKSYVGSIKQVRKIDEYTVEIETAMPYPILPEVLTTVYMMSRPWCEAQGVLAPSDARSAGASGRTLMRANGTGPFRLGERQPGVRTVFVRNTGYWAPIESNAAEVVFTPIARDADRLAALLSGRVDVMQPVPVEEIARVNANPGTRAVTGPELRTIFLGMDQQRSELLYSSVRGRNPFKDARVRRAFYQAIDIDGIRKDVMRGASNPAAWLVGPGVNGFQADAKRLPYDVAAAKRLMAEAGYAEGFEITLNCPDDRYVNDARICQAVTSNLSRIQVKVRLKLESRRSYFPRVLRRDTSFYLLGWAPSTYDAEDALGALVACPDGKGAGQYNLGGYCNPRVDALIRRIAVETDKARRDAMIREAFQIHAEDVGHLPLHQQQLAWGVSDKLRLVQLADNNMPFKWMSIQ